MPSHNLSVGAFGNEVRHLHDQLRRRYDLPAAEVERAFFGPGTREVVQKFQRDHNLKATGSVDSATRAALESAVAMPGQSVLGARASGPASAPTSRVDATSLARREARLVAQPSDIPPEEELLVRGQVVYKDGLLIEGMTVRAYNRDLRHEDFLGEALSDREGRFEIAYSARQFSRPEKQYADLVLRVYDLREGAQPEGQEPQPIAESATIFGAQPVEKRNIVVEGGIANAWSEYEQIMEELIPLLGDTPITSLTEDAENQDITFLASQANHDPHNIARLVWAHNQAAKIGLPPEVLYGFARQNLPLTLPELLAQGQEVQRTALQGAIYNHIIPGQLAAKMDEILKRLRELVVEQAFEPPRDEGRASLGSLLSTVLPNKDTQAKFLSAFVEHTGGVTSFWETLRGQDEFKDKVRDLQLTIQLGALTGNSVPLTDTIRKQEAFTSLRDLARYDVDDWQALIAQSAEGDTPAVPPEIQGKDDAEKARNYAATITRLIADTFPTETVAHRFQKEAAAAPADLRTFFTNVLQQDTGFELGLTVVGKYLAENPTVLAGVDDKAGLETQLKRVQRAFRLAPRFEEMKPLLDQGFHSALDVARLGETAFMAQVQDRLGETTARNIYARAEYVTAAALSMFTNFNPALSGIGMNVLPWTKPVVEGVPDWESLFGSLDLCACEECRSVHSPAAYLVEMLAWLHERKARTANMSVRDVLFRRRPDLGDIELTCANTTTPMPYIDLSNEVLENAVAPFSPIALAPTLVGQLATGPLTAEVRDALAAQGITFESSPTVVETRPGDQWLVTDHADLYVLQQSGGQLQVTARCAQTSGSSQELLANPQHTNRAAYETLRGAVFPLVLPFDLWVAEGRAFLAHLGVPRHELMRVLYPQGEQAALTDPAIAAEYLGLTTLEAQLITDTVTAAPPTWQLWGLQEAGNQVPDPTDPGTLLDAGWTDVLKRVRLFLDRTHLNYEELTDLLMTRFVDPDEQLSIVSTDPENPGTCDMAWLSIAEKSAGQFASALRRMVRFIRLWRALGWTMHEVDMAIAALQGQVANVNARLNQAFLVQLSHVNRLRETLELPVERLLTLWGPIDTYGEGSLYQRLFQNPVVLKPIDPAFKLAGAELASVTTAPDEAKISKHVPTIVAALGISEQDLEALTSTEVTDDALTLANLSHLFRVVVLSRGLRLPVPQVLGFKTLTGGDPFDLAHTEYTLRFVEIVDKVRAAGFTPVELAYLFQQSFGQAVLAGPDDDTIALILDDVRANLQKIQAENEPAADPNGELTRQKLALLRWDVTLIEQAIATLKGNAAYTTPLAALPSGIVFPEGVRDRVTYDPTAQRLAFLGPLTLADQIALLGVSGETVYQAAVRALFRMPRDFVAEKMKAFEMPVFSTPLDQLPDGLAFSAILRSRIYFDAQATSGGVRHPQLCFIGMMSDAERQQLLSLSDEPAYQAAINALYVLPTSYTPDATNVFLTAADAAWLFDTARPGGDRFERVLRQLLPYLRKRLSASLVKQKLGEALRLEGRTIDQLLTRQITAPSDPTQPIIAEFLAPQFSESNLALPVRRVSFERQFRAFTRLHKIALLAGRFKMTQAQLTWLFQYGSAAGWPNLNELPLDPVSPVALFAAWEHLADLIALRDVLPGGETTVGEILAIAAGDNTSTTYVLERLATLTNWNLADLQTLASRLQVPRGAVSVPLSQKAAYLGEGALCRLWACAGILKRLGTAAARAIEWTKLDLTDSDATEIIRAAKAKYEDEQWPEIARPIRDTIRERQRDALVGYLLAEPDPDPDRQIRWRDPGDLYQYYLIDVEMSACMLTSRIKQAISSVQIFVQRCLMELEPLVKADEVHDARWRDWKWMKSYRVWEANRKVFLYPENWIEPELRDDKSPFFKDMENELLQNETTQETAEDAFLHYLEKLDVVARLDVVGMYHEQDDGGTVDIVHVFARTHQAPHLYYYRQRLGQARWSPWEKVDLDIEGDHLIPVVWNRRLYLFWPVFMEKAKEDATPAQQTADNQSIKQPEKFWEIQLAWSEYKRKKWLPKQVSQVKLTSDAGPTPNDRDSSRRQHLFYAVPDDQGLSVFCFHSYKVEYPYPYFPPVIRSGWKGGEFRFTGCGGEVFLRDSWTRTILTVRGTRPEAMEFVEDGSIGLYLPKSLTTAEDGLALRSTPGAVPFALLPPHQDLSLTGRRPFFFQDDTRTYFISPEEVTITSWTWRNPEVVSPTLIDQVRVKYYVGAEKVSQVALHGAATRLAASPVLAAFAPSWHAGGDSHQSIVSREVSQILTPKWEYTAPVVSVSRRERRYRFHNFFHPHQCLFIRRLNRDGLDGLLRRDLQLTSADPFAARYGPTDLVMKTDPQGKYVYPIEDVDFSYIGAYSQYNWEIFFHAPLLIARKLSQNQRFDEAQRWYHYIFDPTDTSADVSPQKYWRTRPFWETSKEDYQAQQIEDILKRLASDTPDPELEQQVSEWRDNPFNPHLIARLRTTAFQKTVVMKYLDNLIAWGDQLFRRDTLESINEATQLYVLAADILGRRPVIIPPRATPTVQTYNSLDPKLSDFADRLVQVENLVVPPSAGAMALPTAQGDRPPLTWPPIPYFCVTPNDKLLGYWDTVADRLFKIRHCMNIEGVVRQLPLFEPPIDPALLVRAAAAGLDIGSVLSDINAPLPPYRFVVLLAKAAELCAEVKTLGQALLSALEKRDAEALGLMRSAQEITLLNKVRDVRQKQKEEAYATWEGLKRARLVTEAKRNYYRDIEERIDEERQHLANLETAVVFQSIGQGIEILAGALALIPEFEAGIAGAFGSPAINAKLGGKQLSTAVQVASRAMSFMAAIYNYMANKASIEGSFKRRWSEWKHQETLANKELDQLDKQIEAGDLRWQVTDLELKSHDQQIENAKAADEFLRNKYTNRELYDWLVGQISGLYFQSYQMAYDMAKRAERAYHYELGIDDTNFIQFGYWDSMKRGLLAGERLYQDVKRLETAYLDQHRREHEITKHVSLVMLDPLALLRLRETGVCYVDLPESLFDVDYPGHYMRRIKSVAVTIPCVTGPYTGVQCTLTMLRNTVRRVSTLRAGKYERAADVEDPRFRDGVGSAQSIVTSSAQNDSGLFELNFRDDRYLPFEGAGAISGWRIELATDFRPFDYDTISDVVLHVRYTTRDGGEALKAQVLQELTATVNQMSLAESRRGLYRWFSLKHEFPTEWYRFLNAAEADSGDHVQTFALVQERFPYLFRGRRVRITGVHLIALPANGALAPFDIYLTPANAAPNDTNDKLTLEPDPLLNGLLHKVKTYQGQEKELGDGWRLRIKGADFGTLASDLADISMVFQYRIENL
jgi:hypothetical protein